MTEWTECRIGKIVDLQQGLCINSKSKHLLAEDGHVLLRITDLIKNTEAQYINRDKIAAKFVSSPEDLIYTRTGQVGLVFKGRHGVIHNNCFKVIPTKQLDADFLFWFLKSQYAYDYANGVAAGAAQPDLGHAPFKSMYIRFPDKETQRKIAAILTAYDDLIRVNHRRIDLLEKMAEELYREWFVRMRFPGHQNTKFVKGVPEGWEVSPISSFCEEIREGVKKKDLADDENYVGLEHIPRKSIAFKAWAKADSVDSNKLRFKERDILFSKIRPYLHKVALAHFSGACSSDTIILRPPDQLYEGFLLFTVFSDTFIELATIAAKGTKMPRADWAFLEKLELKIPPPELLETYQFRFEEIFSLITILLQTNQHATESRDLLLPRLISGRLSVEDLDIQFPPSMLEKSAEPEVAHA